MSDKIEIQIIGADGVLRKSYTSKDAKYAMNKYRIVQSKIFYVPDLLFGIFPWGTRGALLFTSNDTEPIDPRTRNSSRPTPDETGDAISTAAISLFRLLGEQAKMLQIIMLICCIIAAGSGAGALYMSYQTQQKINTFQGAVENITQYQPSYNPNVNPPIVTPTPHIPQSPPIVART